MTKQARTLKSLSAALLICGLGAADAAQTAYECTGTSTITESDGNSESINQKTHTLKVVLDLDRKVRVFANGRTAPVEVVKTMVVFTDQWEKRVDSVDKSNPASFSKTTQETTIDLRSGSYLFTQNTVQLVEGKKYTLDSQTSGSCKSGPVTAQ